MAQIFLQEETKARLDSAIKKYCTIKNLPPSVCSRVSYDAIITEILNEVDA